MAIKKKIGILTAGGDCPGINAAIRGVAKTAMVEYGWEVYGFLGGFTGLINNKYTLFKEKHLSGMLQAGGTILGTSREKPFKKNKEGVRVLKKPEMIKRNYKNLGLDCVVCIGGNGTMRTSSLLAKEGLSIIGLPKTIDNDVWGTDITFGFDSALGIATDAIDRLHTTANSHRRTMVIELMGHHAGWLSLYAGLAGGGDIILIPEIKYDEEVILDTLERRKRKKKPYSIIVVAEGIKVPSGGSAANYISERIEFLTGIEIRKTILGYIQRGGAPSAMDRILATQYGSQAVELIAENNYGQMVAMQQNSICSVPLDEVENKVRLVPKDNFLIQKARNMDVCFGDRKINGT